MNNTDDFQETSDIYHSDDDSLMQEFTGEYTPFGPKLASGPNLLLQNEDDEYKEEMMFQDENNETNQMIQKMMQTGNNLNSKELEQFLS